MKGNVHSPEVEHSKNPKGGAGEMVTLVKDTTVMALEGARDIGSAAIGGVVHVVAGSTSQALKVTEEVSGDLADVSKKVVANWVRGLQGMAAAVGSAWLESARGSVQGASLVGGDLGLVAKGAALGLIQGGSEVGAELGKVCKSHARGAIKGLGEVGSDLVTVTKNTAIEAIKGTTEAALVAEGGFMQTARALVKDVVDLKASYAASQAPTQPLPASAPEPEVVVKNGKHN